MPEAPTSLSNAHRQKLTFQRFLFHLLHTRLTDLLFSTLGPEF